MINNKTATRLALGLSLLGGAAMLSGCISNTPAPTPVSSSTTTTSPPMMVAPAPTSVTTTTQSSGQ